MQKHCFKIMITESGQSVFISNSNFPYLKLNLFLENSIKTGSQIVLCDCRSSQKCSTHIFREAIYEYLDKSIDLFVSDLEHGIDAFKHSSQDDLKGFCESDVRQFVDEKEKDLPPSKCSCGPIRLESLEEARGQLFIG